MRWNLVLDGGQSVADRFLARYQALTGTSLDDEPYWDLVSLCNVLLDIDPDHPGDIDADDHHRLTTYVKKVLAVATRVTCCLVRVCPQPYASARTSLHAQLPAEFGTRLLSDQLSDYRVDDPYIQAHLHGPSSRLVLALDGSPTVLHTEEVTGSNPVSPTLYILYQQGNPRASETSVRPDYDEAALMG